MATHSPEKPAHIPVMLKEVLHHLAPKEGGIYIDGTFGLGGYSRSILEAANCRVFGIDRDPEAIKWGKLLEQEYPGRFRILKGRFGDMVDLLREENIAQVDGVALDLGVSSPQLDVAERGFSFRFEGPLDMRMELEGRSAADAVNHFSDKALADIIYYYGEERYSRRIAHKIIEERKKEPILTTTQLAEIVRSVVPRSKDGIDPATRTFQALRIYVNDEIVELERGLEAAEVILAPQGHLVVVSFHSLEDRCVKGFLRERSGYTGGEKGSLPLLPKEAKAPTFKLSLKRAISASEEESKINPRARSAKLRAAERTSVPFEGEAK